jgi:hypothetical protein
VDDAVVPGYIPDNDKRQRARMSLLREIQALIVEENQNLGSIMLKLRLLAARLGSSPLEDWVKYESEGYPANVEVPDYRKIGVSYRASFSGPFGSGINNAPIPSYLVQEHCGEQWVTYEVRQSVAGLDDLLSSSSDGDGTLTLETSNLILLLQGKVYEGYNCNSVTGIISRAALTELQHSVRTRILELTIELERSVPIAAEVGLSKPTEDTSASADTVTQITNQTIYGNVTAISSTGSGATVNIQINKNDEEALVKYLEDAGLASSDASEIASIVASEEPESAEEPFGAKAKAWIAKNIQKAADGTWKIGFSVATKVLTEAALKFYGLK